MPVVAFSPPVGPVFLPINRPIYRIRIAWGSAIYGVFQLDRSVLGGPDVLAASSWSETFMGEFDDVTDDTIVWTTTVGRNDDLSQVQSGTCTLTLRDKGDGHYNPENVASPLYGDMRPMRPCKIEAFFDGEWHDRYYGFIRTIQFKTGQRIGQCSIELNDLMMWLDTGSSDHGSGIANPVIDRVTNPTVGQCIGLVLDAIGWIDESMRSLEPGDTIPWFQADGTVSGLQLIENLLAAVGGYFYIDRSGRAVYEGRETRYLRASIGTIQNTMSEISPGVTIDRVQNQWTAVRQTDDGMGGLTDGTPQVTRDEPSIDEFGLRDPGPISSPYFPSDTFAKNYTEWGLIRTREPSSPIWSLTLDYRTHAQMAAIVASGFGQRITLDAEKADTAGDYIIEQIVETVTRADRNHRADMVLSRRDDTLVPFVIGVDELDGVHGLGF